MTLNRNLKALLVPLLMVLVTTCFADSFQNQITTRNDLIADVQAPPKTITPTPESLQHLNSQSEIGFITGSRGCATPKYTEESKKNNEEGKVVIKFLVDDLGEVIKIQVLKTSGFRKLDEESIWALSQCKFEAKDNNLNIEDWRSTSFTWRLELKNCDSYNKEYCRGSILLTGNLGNEKYIGDLLWGVPNGWGTLAFPDGSKYEGQFRAGLQNGFGTLYLKNGEELFANWKDGHITEMVKTDDSVFTAPFAKPKRYISAVVDQTKDCFKTDYPARAKKHEQEGVVTLKFIILENGAVSNILVKKSSGSDELDQTAIKALSKCQFVPATEDGNSIKSWSQLNYTFRLK